ncbi:hypothetical protein EGW08_022256 [Elysia chlorotica]|uniref:Uncharacterized protein n=1 Tax=Elysia chlorotica TaxID=188477 RepID=A0A433SLH2_ELYCH|nr:hypothetical protein EGW08_022256 [Elysia chlorotica]
MSARVPQRSPPEAVGQSQARPYQEYVAQHRIFLATCRANWNKDVVGGHQLCRQMLIGFSCAGIVGLIMLVVGTVFIAEAVRKEQPITVMLCVMGIVFGTIILVGTIILGRHLISKKCMNCHDGDTIPASQCFHTCSVIYSPSLDQIGSSESSLEPPPTYDTAISIVLHPLNREGPEYQPQEGVEETSIMVLPPKYEDVMQPLPVYTERESDCVMEGISPLQK